VRFADYVAVADARATIDYTTVAPNQLPTKAAVTRYGTVDGQAGSPTQGVAYEWKLQTATVLVEAVTDEQGEPEASTTYQYDTNLNIVARTTPSRTPIPHEAEHRFHGKPNSHSTASRTPVPRQAEQ